MNTQQQNENTTKKPNNRMLRGMCYLFGLSVMIAWVIGVYKNNTDKAMYVVKDKGAQKISYAPIENQYDIHTMNFNKFYMDSMLYDNINIGDTILGRKSRLDDTVSQASYADMYNAFRLSNIFFINKHSLTQLDKLYRTNTR